MYVCSVLDWLWCSWSDVGYIKCSTDEFAFNIMMFTLIH